ncbi:MAG: hypothetical protein IV107_22755 [Paucibacter sp.]|nr:hypothetical protein [Roseateles sp.]
MADNSFSKFVPGFDFLQGLMKGAGAAMPGVGQWVAPTLNPEELAKRIDELRTVQFWLEQNARMLGVTIQALEVQKMTLATLKSMNVPLEQLSEALQVPVAAAANPLAAAWPGLAPEVKVPPVKEAAPQAPAAPSDSDAKTDAKLPAAGAVDPLQWWGALSQQFTQLAANAMKDSTTDAAKNLAGSIVKQSLDVAGDTLRKAGAVPGAVAGQVAKSLTPKPTAKAPAAAKATPAAKRKL